MHIHTCRRKKKKTRDIINIWMLYANGRERADVVAFNWPICELHPNLSLCFLGPLSTVLTGFLVPLSIWAGSTVILAVFKHKKREMMEMENRKISVFTKKILKMNWFFFCDRFLLKNLPKLAVLCLLTGGGGK